MKGQGLPISTIIIAALGILVLVVIGAIFGGQMGKFGQKASECLGKCYKLNPPAVAPMGIYVSTKCDPNFETTLSGAYLPKNMPSKVDNYADWRCDECCVQTG